MYVLIILGYIVIGVIEIVPLYKKNRKKELAVYIVFFMAAFSISLLLSLGVKIPSPSKPIENIVKAIVGE